jgi:hypothetical protein
VSFWNKKPPEGETEEQKKQREEKEQNEFIEKIGVTLDAKVKAAVGDLSAKVTSWDDRWKKLEEAAAGGEGGGEGGGGSGDEELTDDQKREKLDREEKNKLLALTIATNARITEAEILHEVHDKFPEFEAKIKDIYANTPIARKGQADYAAYCRNVMKMVVGEAALAGGLRYDSASKQFFLENSSGGGDGETHEFLASDMNWTDPTSGRTLSARDQLNKLGITPEDFAKSVKAGVV